MGVEQQAAYPVGELARDRLSCSAENQPGSGADIELWVAGMATSVSGRSQSRESPSHATGAGAAVVVPPDPRKMAIAPPITATAAARSEPPRAEADPAVARPRPGAVARE